MKTTKKLTQTDVLESMLLNNQLVTGSTVYKETKRITGCGSLNTHVLMRPLKEKYNIVGYWCVDKKGNRFKSWEIVNYSVNKNKRKVSKRSK